jgi:hypothetical protein
LRNGKAVRPTGEDRRATPFDLVYVFAITQISGSMARERDADGVFVVGLTITEVWADGLRALVWVGAYLLVRWVHLAVYAAAAHGDPGLRRQIAITWLPLLVSGALLGGCTARRT